MPFRVRNLHLSPIERARLRAEDQRHPGHRRRVKTDDVLAIRFLDQVGYPQDDIALLIGCSQGAVSAALRDETKTAQRA
jgi:predicted DNA-binding protein (UPF0251 family)